MGDAASDEKENAPARREPAVAPEVNRLLLPPEVYPRAAAPPRPAVRPHVASPPAAPSAPSAPSMPEPRAQSAAPAPSTLPPSQSFGPLLDLVTVPALGELGMQPDETRRLMGSIKGALDAFTDGKPQEALPVPQSMEKMSKMAEHLLPVVQDVVLPRLPFVIAGIQGLLKPQEPATPPAGEPTPAPPSPTQRARQAGASVKDALKQKAGQTVADGGKLISFPDESREPDFTTPHAPPAEAAYTGPRSPPNMADVARRESKIQFYGAKDPVPGADVATHTPAKPRPSAADADAIRRLAPSGPSFTPANVAEGTWANERREGHEPRPDPATPPRAAPAAQEPTMTETPKRSSLTPEEAKFILDGVRGQDPALIEGLIGANMDISGFVLAKKARLQPAQRDRLKVLDFADLLALGEDLAAQDAGFAERWRVLMKPKGRAWLKDNLKRIQGGL